MKKRVVGTLSVLVLVLLAGIGYWGHRAYRTYDIARSWHDQLRYLVASGGNVGSVPASQAFSSNFLEEILGDNQELLEDLRAVIGQGLEESPALNLGEVTAINIIYERTEAGENENMVVHVAGGFPIEARQPGFHRDGYFKGLLDSQLYSVGSRQASLLGRDMIFFTSAENHEPHREVVDALYQGEILPLAGLLTNRVYHTTVFPNPANAMPMQLRRHVKTVVARGYTGAYEGSWDILLVTGTPDSAKYVLSVLKDMKQAAEVTLATAMMGEPVPAEWGGQRYLWWARAMLQTSRASRVEQVANTVRIRTAYDRHMVNASLKTVERAMRDYRAIRERFAATDPRFARALARADEAEREAMILERDARRITRYWSEDHVPGPDWPIAPQQAEAPPQRGEDGTGAGGE